MASNDGTCVELSTSEKSQELNNTNNPININKQCKSRDDNTEMKYTNEVKTDCNTNETEVVCSDKATEGNGNPNTMDAAISNNTDAMSEMKDDVEENISDVKIKNAPVDRGWAWMILAACTFEIFVYGGINRSFGVFFLQYQIRFHSNASETAMMSLIQNVVLSVTALFVMTVGLEKFSSRVSVVIGGLLTFLAFFITAFATNINVYYFAQGVLGGVGLAMLHPPMFAILGVYFCKHRGLANSIFTSGGALGGLMFAPIVVKLFDEYQYTGGMLIASGLVLNIIVSGLLLRPIEFYTKHKMRNSKMVAKISNVSSVPCTETAKVLQEHEPNICNSIDGKDRAISSEKVRSSSTSIQTTVNNEQVFYNVNVTEFMRMHSYDPDIAKTDPSLLPLIERVHTHSIVCNRSIDKSKIMSSEGSTRNLPGSNTNVMNILNTKSKSNLTVYTSCEGICGPFVDIDAVQTHTKPADDNETNKKSAIDKTESKHAFILFKSAFLSVLGKVFDTSLLRKPVFLTFLLMAFMFMSGVALVPVYIPPHAADIGISNTKIGLIGSILAAIDLISKITVGIIADRQWIRRTTLLAIVAFLLSTACHLIRFATTFETMIIFVVVAGICCGQYISMYALVLIDILGPENFKSSLGFSALIHGTSIAIFFPVAGLLRDNTGNYLASYHLLGILGYLSGVLVLLIPLVDKWTRKCGNDVKRDNKEVYVN